MNSRHERVKSLAPGDRLGTYEVLAAIGAGGMGEVYRAYDTLLNREVALKVLSGPAATNAARLRQFEREAQILATLNHPNIATIYGVTQCDTGPALVLELVEGLTLQDCMAPGALPIETALQYARQIAAALEAAHEHGIVHRRLRPANIKVGSDGPLKLLDFGIATLAGGAQRTRTQRSSPEADGALSVASTYYMSPEQTSGRDATRRSDIWSYGAILYEMLTGNRPFGGASIGAIFAAIATGAPDWGAMPAAIPPAIDRLARGCLERDPGTRLRGLGTARRTIERVMAGLSPARSRGLRRASGSSKKA